jgi:flagellar hook protein FlgE
MSLFGALKQSKNSMSAYETALNIHISNLNASNTDGYKALEYSFQEVFNHVLNQGSAPIDSTGYGEKGPTQYGGSAAISQVKINFTQGDITTGTNLDAAIMGDGLFVVGTDRLDTSGENLYTRNGRFHIEATSGNLVDTAGRVVYGYRTDASGNADKSQLVVINTTGLNDIGFEDGGLLVEGYQAKQDAIKNNLPNIPASTPRYRLAVATFRNNSGLVYVDGTAFKQTESSGFPLTIGVSRDTNLGQVFGAKREKSNVSQIGESLDAVEVQRAMTASLSALRLVSQQIQTVINSLTGGS